MQHESATLLKGISSNSRALQSLEFLLAQATDFVLYDLQCLFFVFYVTKFNRLFSIYEYTSLKTQRSYVYLSTQIQNIFDSIQILIMFNQFNVQFNSNTSEISKFYVFLYLNVRVCKYLLLHFAPDINNIPTFSNHVMLRIYINQLQYYQLQIQKCTVTTAP